MWEKNFLSQSCCQMVRSDQIWAALGLRFHLASVPRVGLVRSAEQSSTLTPHEVTPKACQIGAGKPALSKAHWNLELVDTVTSVTRHSE